MKSQAAREPQVVALMALAHIVSDERLRHRFMAMSGLTADDLRSRAGSGEVQAAVLDFLAGHEPDLLACAGAIGLEPADIQQARHTIGGA